MYLLHRDGPGQSLRLSQFYGAEIPPYAILSHTWGPEDDEVSFKDVRKNRGREKNGYKKIQFCLARAEADGLRHCWVDTCCIDQRNNVELSEAINSMFWWYSKAKKCYVYLSDVPLRTFRDSRWFTRGWTLQELLAPRNVEFFDLEGNLLGDKLSMVQELHDITKVPLEALEGCSLSRFDFAETVSWISNRHTKREEDMAYSLLGLFDVSMPLIYGERSGRAFGRLKKHVDESQLAQATYYSHGQDSPRDSFSVPFRLPGVVPSAVFLGRNEEMTKLEVGLPLNGLRKCVILHGVGGIGKTQLALHFATKRQSDYSAIFWIDGRTEDSMEESFSVARGRLQSHNLPSAVPNLNIDSDANHDAMKTVLTWLRAPGNARWLIIIDNVDDPYIRGKKKGLYNVQSYLPSCNHGHVIITSRSPQLDFGKQLELRGIQDDAACLELLKHHSRRRLIELEPGTQNLLKILGGLPLALCQAGASLAQSTMDVSQYLTTYEKYWASLQCSSPILLDYQGRALETTWVTSLKQVETTDPTTARLLRLLANFDYRDVWYELLAAGRNGAPEWFVSIIRSQASFDYHMQILCNAALFRVCDSPSAGYEMHGFMHDWLRATSSQERGSPALALGCISRSVPADDTRDYWVQQQRLLRHADHFLKLMSRQDSQDALAADDIETLGRLYHDQGRLVEAEAMYRTAIRLNDENLGLHCPSATRIHGLLGVLQHDQGRLAESEAKLTRVLQMQESASDGLQPWVLETVRNLGQLYLTQDRLPDAQSMLTRAFHGFVSTYGYNHPSTLRAAGSLARLYDPARMAAKQAESKAMYMLSLDGFQYILGKTHPLYLTTLAEYGQSCWLQYEDAEGEPALSQALSGLRRTLGQNHMQTLRAEKYHAAVLLGQDKIQEAGSHLRKNITLSKQHLGLTHLLTIDMEELLAQILSDNDPCLAEELFLQALKEREEQLGSRHILTLLTLSSVGRHFRRHQKFTDSEEHLQRALEGFERRSPLLHRTFQAMYDIATLYVSLGKDSLAETMFMRAIAGYETNFGPDYHKLASALFDLAMMYESKGKYYEAEQLWLRSLAIDEEKYGTESKNALETRFNMGLVYEKQRKWLEALSMYEKVYAGSNRLFGSEHALARKSKRSAEKARLKVQLGTGIRHDV